jgi:trigger factor
MAEEDTTSTDEQNTSNLLVEGPPEGEAPKPEEAAEEKLEQAVEVTDVGPCKKHIKVTVDRGAIDERFNEKYTELVRSDTSQVNGFRPGKAPRKVIERRFKTHVEETVRQEVLMASLEQLATDNKISPLSPPDLDPTKLEIPDSGPFIYEFDVEVRPEFDLPPYKGMRLKRPVKTFTADDIEKEKRRILEPAGSLIPKNEPVALNDYIIADVLMLDGEREMNNLKEIRVKIEPELVLKDGVADQFGKTMVGAKAGDVRNVEIKLSEALADPSLRGKTITAKFTINDVKFVRLPEMTPALLGEFGLSNEDQFEELIEAVLNQRLEYAQRQSFRAQILTHIAESSKWELPEDLLIRQSKRALQKRVMEMRSSGMSEEQIVARRRKLEQDAIANTAIALREHFILQKIAELEKIEIDDEDIDNEIERIADRAGESPRKVRARMEKEDLIESLATELLERKSLDLILESAEYDDYELKSEDEEGEVATVSAEAVKGGTPEATETP